MKTNRSLFLIVVTALYLYGQASLQAALLFSVNWVTDPGNDARSTWNSVESYYQSVFSNSYSGETWTIQLDWQPLSSAAQGGPLGNNTLGSTLRSYGGALTDRIADNAYYVPTLANHLAGQTVVSGATVTITFSSNTTWDYSTTSVDSDKESFYTTAVHELAHGLGFISNDVSTGGWTDNQPGIFDYNLGLGATDPQALFDMTTEQLASAFVSDNVYWTGSSGNEGNGGNAVKIFAPTTYSDGSSMSHIDPSVVLSQSLIMYPAEEVGRTVNFTYSAMELGMFRDMGYDVVPEPRTWALLGLAFGFGCTVLIRRKFRMHSLFCG